MVTVRLIGATDWRELREIRIRALRGAPEAFLTTAAQAEAERDEYWMNRAAMAARGDRWGIFLAHAESGDAVGMASGIEDPARRGEVELIQMWVDRSWRNRSVGAQLVEAVVQWGALRADRIRLGVATDNLAAMALYARSGFVPTGEEEPFKGRPGISVRYYERTVR
jgi:RimJ/RimL family protein N-acetyltransferase